MTSATTEIQSKVHVPAPPQTGIYVLDVMTENIERLRNNDLTPTLANAMVNQISAQLRVLKMQIDLNEKLGVTPVYPPLLISASPNGKDKD